MGNFRKHVADQGRVFRALEFVGLGFKDYIGARTLLLQELPLQGATLGSSAVEKFIKALLSLRGEKAQGHLKKSHISSLKNYAPDLAAKLNPEFLEFLEKCYRLRYTDGLPPNFNLSVYAREVLAELDHTIIQMESQMVFRRSDGSEVATMYRSALENKDHRLLSENHVLQQQDKATFLSKPDVAYGIRNRPVHGLLEVEFKVYSSPMDGKFCREAVIPVSNAKGNAA